MGLESAERVFYVCYFLFVCEAVGAGGNKKGTDRNMAKLDAETEEFHGNSLSESLYCWCVSIILTQEGLSEVFLCILYDVRSEQGVIHRFEGDSKSEIGKENDTGTIRTGHQ